MKSIYLETDFIATTDAENFILEIDAGVSIFQVKVDTDSLQTNNVNKKCHDFAKEELIPILYEDTHNNTPL